MGVPRRSNSKPTLTLTESQFVRVALAMLGAGERDAVDLLRTLPRNVRPTLVPRMGQHNAPSVVSTDGHPCVTAEAAQGKKSPQGPKTRGPGPTKRAGR